MRKTCKFEGRDEKRGAVTRSLKLGDGEPISRPPLELFTAAA
jgi:hypothetical protein